MDIKNQNIYNITQKNTKKTPVQSPMKRVGIE